METSTDSGHGSKSKDLGVYVDTVLPNGLVRRSWLFPPWGEVEMAPADLAKFVPDFTKPCPGFE
jgi:hypothetical protein